MLLKLLQEKTLTFIYKVLFISFLVIIPEIAYCKISEIDSLQHELKIPGQPDTIRIKTMVRLGGKYTDNNNDSAIYYLKQGIQLAKDINFSFGLGFGNAYLGDFYLQRNNYKEAENYFKLAQQSGFAEINQKFKGNLFNRFGQLYFYLGKYELSTENYLKALEIKKQLNDSAGMASVYLNIGVNFDSYGNLVKAIEYYVKCLKIDESLGNKEALADDYNSIAILYKRQGEIDLALDYHTKSLEVSKQADYQFGIGSNYVNMGVIYKDLKQYDKSLDVNTKAVAIFEKLKNDYAIDICSNNLGILFYKKGNYKKSLEYFEKAYKISSDGNLLKLKINNLIGMSDTYRALGNFSISLQKANEASKLMEGQNYKDENRDLNNSLSQTYEAMGNYERALFYHKLYNISKDSLLNEEKNNQINRLRITFESDKKDAEIKLLSDKQVLQDAQLKQSKLLRNLVLVLFFFTGILGFILLRNYRLKQEQKRLQLNSSLEREQLEAKRLQELDELKSRFYANIAHEFRTPLTLILGPAQNILENSTEAYTLKNSQQVVRAGKTLLNLVDELLELSKLEEGKIRLHKKNTDFKMFLGGITYSFDTLAKEKNIELTFNSQVASLQMAVDPDRTDKIFYNLLSNAFKFTPTQGKITVTLNTPDTISNTVSVEVSDTGIGIPPENLKYIFDRFYRVNDTSTQMAGGSGIGLSLTSELVELHSGNIRVESKQGEGSRFIVTLPLEICTDELTEPVKFKNQLVNTSIPDNKLETIDIDLSDPKPEILVIEDNEEVRNFIIDSLKADYKTIEAINGKHGVEKAIQNVPDLIITDVMMPEMDGFEACTLLKNDIITSHIPVIMLTAKSGTESKIEGLETGADDYLAKPFHRKELLVRMKNLIQSRELLKKKYQNSSGEAVVQIPKNEDKFLVKIRELLNKQLDNENFGIDEVCREMAVSRTQLHRKIKALTDLSTSHFIRRHKLAKAVEFLTEGDNTISEVSYMVGFSSPSYFTQCFQEDFGYPPSEVKRQIN